MKYSFQKVPSLTNSPLPSLRDSVLGKTKKKKTCRLLAHTVQFSFYLTPLRLKQNQKKTSIDGVSFNVALKQKHSQELRLLTRVHVQETSAVQTVYDGPAAFLLDLKGFFQH